jgi:hypothetical protein
MFDETEKNFAEPELALLNRRSIQVLNSEFGFAVLNSCLLFRSPRACQYFLSLFASANTVPGVIDFRLFFRSQVPRERWAFLFARRAWREREIDHLYPQRISSLTLRLTQHSLRPIAR